jgi:hypothetical protein
VNKTAIIVLEYLEGYFRQTLDSLNGLNADVFYAYRDGVGSMSRAYNDAYNKHVLGLHYDNVWFVSNITFLPEVLEKLEKGIEGYGAIHPAFNSDHKHIRPDGSGQVKEVPFIEFTAPMFKTWVFEKYMLNDSYWYWFYDLIISKQMRDAGIKMATHHGAEVGHVYLRNNKKEEISQIRERLRNYRHKIEIKQLEQEYGKNWNQILFKYD